MKCTFMTCMTFMLPVLALVTATPIHLARDVWVPRIITPNATAIWPVNSTQLVTWDKSGAPAQVTNPVGRVVLAKGGIEDYEHPIAQGFQLSDGSVTVKIGTNVVPGDDYAIVLFGDSGNLSPTFQITT